MGSKHFGNHVNESDNSEMSQPSDVQITKLIDCFQHGENGDVKAMCEGLLKDYSESAVVFNVLGAVLQKDNQWDLAIEAFDQAILLKPTYSGAYNNRGIALKTLSRHKEALDDFEQALQFEPGSIEILFNQAFVVMELGKHKEAADIFEQIIAIDKNNAQAYFFLGNALRSSDVLENALACYHQAIMLNPTYAGAYCQSGNVLMELGRVDEAVENLQAAIRLKPSDAMAYHTLGMLKPYVHNDDRIKAMEEQYAISDERSSDKMYFCFALAKAYDDLGEYDTSFGYLKEGNDLRKQALGYTVEVDQLRASHVKALYLHENVETHFSDTKTEHQPVFVVGMLRSGTSLVEQILASHSQVYGAGEMEALPRILEPLIMSDRKTNAINYQSIIEIVREDYGAALTVLPANGNIIIDKMPLNFFWVGIILAAFPHAKIINTVRDARATCWSIYKHCFTGKGNGYAYDLDDLAEFYQVYIDLMAFWRKHFPENIYDIHYETLTCNQEEETRKLLWFCGLEWESSCLDFHVSQRAVKTASANQVRRKMYSGSSDVWRYYARHLQPLINGLKQ